MEEVSQAVDRRPLSYPKDRIKVLLLENIHQNAELALKAEGYRVETAPGSLSEEELCQKVRSIQLLGIRSRTHLTDKVFASAKHLLAVGAFSIGTNQIDLDSAGRHGVAVFNAPFSNTRSVVELAMGEMIMLMRQTFEKATQMHAGVWNKSAVGSHEIRGKRLGIIGYGNIGSQLSIVAEALGLEVIFYDVEEKLAFGNSKLVSLPELLATSDIITVHVDGRPENNHFIGADQFASMKDGALFLNLSRGFVVDEHALAAALKTGKLAGAATDVYEKEPGSNSEPFTSPLIGLQNVILTPHIASGTEEAQRHIGQFVSGKLISFINSGDTKMSVNMPNLKLADQAGTHRLLHVHHNEPGVLAAINNAMARSGANIAGQYLSTRGSLGYVITDIERRYSKDLEEELARIPATIKVRILY